MDIIPEFQKAYTNRHTIARNKKKEGKKIAGCLYSLVPEEMVFASGMMPIQVTKASVHSGSRSTGATVSVTWIMTYANSRYATPTRNTFLRLSSSNRPIERPFSSAGRSMVN